ncbi:Interferon-inducible double stranded RNA-dependent protein kinase activator A B [Gryllus bimaculatus]|nr:Interferon-inducible double stranded RNA-dependent protein kinase activator A B [Gryllus bimaculatus]
MVEFPSCFGQPSAHSSTSTSFFCADPRRLALLRGVPDLRARAIAAGQRSRTRSSATAPRPPRRTADLCVCWRQREVDGKSVSRVENHFQTQMWQPPSPKRARSEVSDLLEKNMTVACVGKTPVSVLQELLSRRGTTPRYELVQIEGAIHEPTFRYRVTVADVVAMGTGRSKKEAKHAAAKALLDKMIVGPGDEGSIPVGNSNTMPEVDSEEYIKHTENGGNTESKVDAVDGTKDMNTTGNCSPIKNILNSFSKVHEVSKNLVMESASKELTLNSLIAKNVSSKKRKYEESVTNDLMESLKLQKLELTIELMKKDCYLKSLEILKLERDLVYKCSYVFQFDGIILFIAFDCILKNEIVSPYDDKIPGNPIGSLQEMCMSRRWPPPSYEMVTEEGLPHERLFTIACTVFKQRELGTGKSKKLAKRMAAHKMWEKLQDAPIASSNMPTGLEDDDENKSLNDATFNFVQFLQEIASEQQFEVTYVDIEENDPISCR